MERWMEERVQAEHLLWCFPLFEAGPWPRGSGAAERKALAVGRPRSLQTTQHDLGVSETSWYGDTKWHQNGGLLRKNFHHGWGGASVCQWIGKLLSPFKLPNLQENRHWKADIQYHLALLSHELQDVLYLQDVWLPSVCFSSPAKVVMMGSQFLSSWP